MQKRLLRLKRAVEKKLVNNFEDFEQSNTLSNRIDVLERRRGGKRSKMFNVSVPAKLKKN